MSIKLFSQDKQFNKLYKDAINFYDNKEYKKADSILRLAKAIYPSKEVFEKLTIVNKLLGDTCQYCFNLEIAKSYGNNDLQKEYSLNCVDSIIYNDSLNKYDFLCLKSKYNCQEGKFQDFYIFKKQTIKYSFTLIDASNEVSFITLDRFPNINENIKNIVFFQTDEYPQFKGGESEMTKYLIDNVSYPKEAKVRGLQGTVWVTFIVDEKGKVKNAKLLKGRHEALDSEALRVVSLMPEWIPGKYKSTPVKVQYNIPIKFILK